jgi:hypothetical protein
MKLESLNFQFNDKFAFLIQIYYQNIRLEILYNFIKLKFQTFNVVHDF